MKINVMGDSNKELLWSVRDLCVKNGMTIQGKFPNKSDSTTKIPGAIKVAEPSKK